jgi:hypothetical protein
MVAQKGEPPLRGCPISLDHVLGDAGLRDLKAKLEQFAMDAWRASVDTTARLWDAEGGKEVQSAAPHSGLSTLIRRISARRSASICGRPPRERDFHRQYRRKPARCHRTRVPGRMIVIAFMIEGKQRYSWIKNKRSKFVSGRDLAPFAAAQPADAGAQRSLLQAGSST